MTDRWSYVRAAAHRELDAAADSSAGLPLVEALLARRGLQVARHARSHALLGGAWAAVFPDMDLAVCDRDLSRQRQAFALAHELGHLALHATGAGCGASEVDPEADPGDAMSGSLEVYNPRQQRELEANVFALDLLAPPTLLWRLFVEDGLDATVIARRLDLSYAATLNALAGLLRRGTIQGDVPARGTDEEPALDASQWAAATAHGAVLVHAGPGTGKTGTLVGRVRYLLEERGVDPRRVLVLTFSNRAVGELRARLTWPSRTLTVSTVHAFAHELLRRYGVAIGLPADFQVLDTPAILVLLRAHLNELHAELGDLSDTISLEYPLAMLSDLATVISRAKDDLIDAGEFSRRTAALPDTEPSAQVQAPFYAWYQRVLAAHGGVDYGDLLMHAVRLLREHAGIRAEVQAAYTHVLVDENQDLNRAGRALLASLAPEESWAVGDPRQSIYRWRGASPGPLNAGTQAQRTIALGVNYRSHGPIARLCGGVAAAMAGDSVPDGRMQWSCARDLDPSTAEPIVLAVATDEEAELGGIAREIQREMSDGRPASDHAVLCSTHAQANAIAAGLQARGVPVSRVGKAEDERVVHAALCLLAVAGGDRDALLGLAPELITNETALALIHDARASGVSALDMLAHPPEWLGEDRRAAARRLARFLRSLPVVRGEQHALQGASWRSLARYLFDGPYAAARPLLAGERGREVTALDALLLTARAYDQMPSHLREATLPAHVQLLLSAGQGLATSEEGPLGVRVLTVHAAKGLEFPVVFVPNLAKGRFPGRGRSGRPVAPGVLETDEAGARAEDDRCLFFVALSRARDRLILSRAERYGAQASAPSPLLALAAEAFSIEPPRQVVWETVREAGPAATTDAVHDGCTRDAVPAGMATAQQVEAGHEQAAGPEVDVFALETYLQCPRRFYYAYQLALRGSQSDGFPHFHQVLRRTLARLHAMGVHRDAATALAALQEEWDDVHEPHPHEDLFLERARRAVLAAEAIPSMTAENGGTSTYLAEYRVARPAGVVRVRIDRVDQNPGETPVAVRYRSGRQADGHRREPRVALYQAALAETYGEGRVQQEYLLSGAVDAGQARPATLETRLRECDNALEGIARGDFPARPGGQCRECPFWLICPGG